MSTLSVANLNDGTHTVPCHSATRGGSKAWLNANGTGSVSIRGSYNISSITDVGSGRLQGNLTSAMFDNEYALIPHANDGSVWTDKSQQTRAPSGERTTTAAAVGSTSENDSSWEDSDYIGFVILGELAT